MKKALLLALILFSISAFAQDSTLPNRVDVGISNASSTGTTRYRLAKLSGAPSKALIAATTDTDGILGVVVSGAGTTGLATIRTSGLALCDFDGATTASNYVSISSSTAGKCHDAGATYPTSGQVVGRVLSTNGSAGTFTIVLTPGTKATGVVPNNAITGATKTKITYDSKGLVTAGADIAASDLPSAIDAAKIANASVSNTEFQSLDGVSSAIQTQLDGKTASTRAINTTAPITGGGDLSADRTIACATCGVTGTGLNQFASTTSLQLIGVISDETGTGSLVFGTSPNITTPTGIVKGDVGLGNVDNTSDANKPVSTATQTALNLKQNTITFGTGVQTALGVNIGSAGAPVLFNGAGGTPSSIALNNATALPDSALSANVPLLNAANTFTGNTLHSGSSFGLTGNISSAGIFGTSGIRYKNVPGTLTDTTSSGTVATNYTNVFGANTLAATLATTITNDFNTYFKDPIAGTNVTLTNKWALGADSMKIGTSNPLTVSNAGVLNATSPVFVTPALGTPASGVATNLTGTAAGLTAGSVTGLSVTAGKTLSVSNSLTLAGTDSTTMTFPTTNATLARTDTGQTFTGTQVFSSTPNFIGSITIANGDMFAVSSRAIGWQSSFARMKSPADGVIDLLNNAETDFSRLQFGGTTSSFPAIKRNAAAINFRLADDSADAAITSAGITASGAVVTSSTTDATTTTSGALQVAGGAAIRKRVFIDGISASAGLQTAVLCQSSGGEMIADSVACLASSGRFKYQVKPLKSGLNEILKFRPVSFFYKPEGIFTNNPNFKHERVGLIAEDVAKVDQRLVGFEKDGVTPRTVGYEQIVPVLIKGMQEQQVEIETLKSQVAKLTEAIANQKRIVRRHQTRR